MFTNLSLKKTIQSALCLLLPFMGLAQTNKEDAAAKANRAFKLEDEEQKYDEAIRLLQDAQKLDPEKSDLYAYEIGYAYYLKKDYTKTINIIEPLKKSKSANPRFFQLIGNSYDYLNKPEKAISTYEEGIKSFPKSGELIMEMGNMMYLSKNYNKALEYYEQGIQADPTFPSNYYRAAKLYLDSKDEVYGMVYGEIFMNLERNSERTAEMSKWLYDTYKSEIKYTSDSSISVSFSQNVIVINNPKDIKKMKLPFGAIYETDLMVGILSEKSIDLNALDRIRQNFLNTYFEKGHNKEYPNVLFDYQQKIKNAGHLEAYNHWVLMKGDEIAFTKWNNANKEKWENFIDWFSKNRLLIDKNHSFYRDQY